MNNHADKENLLIEVFAEASPADFRAAMLAETLSVARRRRQFHQTRRVVGVLMVMGLVVILFTQQFSKPPVISQPIAKKIMKQNYELVLAQPMPISAVISTRTFTASQLVSSAGTVVEISTTTDGFREINDDQLLALLSDKPAVLIRTGPNSEELVFANADDQRSFIKN
jgi:hypothetical protein